MIRIPFNYPDLLSEKWKTCRLCGEKFVQAEVPFTGGKVEPTVGETVTGATSSKTGTVHSWQLDSGTWAGADAAGRITLSSPSSFTDNLWGTEDEVLNGSTAGTAFATMDGQGFKKVYGVFHPRSELVLEDGGYYCKAHHAFKFKVRRRDENILQVTEDEKNEF